MQSGARATDDDPEACTVAYPAELREAEAALIAARREQARPPDDRAAPRPLGDTVGLALSGGGIRSATFCLGVLQSLASRALLGGVDFLSTVSGGGYCGSFLGALVCRPAWGDPPGTRAGVLGAQAELADEHSPSVAWLREHGRYLSPTGSGDSFIAFATVLRNWVALQTVIITAIVALCALLTMARLIAEAAWPAFAATQAVIWWSPFWWLSLLMLVAATPFGWAYWIVPPVDPKTGHPTTRTPIYNAALVMLLCAGLTAAFWTAPARTISFTAAFIAVSLGFALAILVWVWLRSANGDVTRDRVARKTLTYWMARFLLFAVVLALLAVIDSLGETLYRWLKAHHVFGGLGDLASLAGAGGAWAVVQQLIKLAHGQGKRRVSLPLDLVATLAATVLAGLVLVAVSAAVYALAGEALLWPAGATIGGRFASPRVDSAAVLFGIAALVSLLLGRVTRFANDSSQQALYRARLACAYLGASNPKRLDGNGAERRVTEPISGDDYPLSKYVPHVHGGPLHLINVTLNETVSGESQVEYRDRKGLAFAVGPAGLSVGVRSHARWCDGDGAGAPSGDTCWVEPIAVRGATTSYRVFPGALRPQRNGGAPGMLGPPQPVEPLSLGTWIAISGAAVAPGLGTRTSLGLSLLLGMFNVRLGYWWDSHILPRDRAPYAHWAPRERLGDALARLFPVQVFFFYELLARFYGPNRRYWYLSDGGHFENTACYELIRRRVPFIIVCDCGQDADFQFADVANLVRKARTDFDAEIRFLSRAELEPVVDPSLLPYFGVPRDFRPFVARAKHNGAGAPAPRPCAMLARIDYGDRAGAGAGDADGVILFLKPTLLGDEPEDVLEYAHEQVDFPHQSTGDQYFDEAQWESYRKLGEVIAERVFAPAQVAGRWAPHCLRKPTLGASPAGDARPPTDPKPAGLSL